MDRWKLIRGRAGSASAPDGRHTGHRRVPSSDDRAAGLSFPSTVRPTPRARAATVAPARPRTQGGRWMDAPQGRPVVAGQTPAWGAIRVLGHLCSAPCVSALHSYAAPLCRSLCRSRGAQCCRCHAASVQRRVTSRAPQLCSAGCASALHSYAAPLCSSCADFSGVVPGHGRPTGAPGSCGHGATVPFATSPRVSGRQPGELWHPPVARRPVQRGHESAYRSYATPLCSASVNLRSTAMQLLCAALARASLGAIRVLEREAPPRRPTPHCTYCRAADSGSRVPRPGPGRIGHRDARKARQ